MKMQNSYSLLDGHTREMYRDALFSIAADRIKDVVYRARANGFKKLNGRDGDWEALKGVIPSWCTTERFVFS